jgi:TPR repeat protein
LAVSETEQVAQQPETQTITPEALFALMVVNAEKGQSKAMLNLGLLYEQGLGVARNFTKALEWYQKAANAGEGEAYMRVGVCYEIGVEPGSPAHHRGGLGRSRSHQAVL